MEIKINITAPEMETTLNCPKCGYGYKEKFRNIKPGTNKKCPHCGVIIEYAGDDLSSIQKSIDDLKKLGK